MDRGDWRATVRGSKESDTTEATGHTHTRASRQLDPAPGVDQVSKFLLFCCRSILMSIKHMVKAGPSHPSLCRREDRTRQAVSLQKMRSGVSHLTLCHILLGEMLQGKLGNVVSERPWGQPYWIGNDLYYLKETVGMGQKGSGDTRQGMGSEEFVGPVKMKVWLELG